MNQFNTYLSELVESKGEYTLKDVFPIKVNDVELNYTTHNVFVAYDASTKSYTLLVSPNKSFCVAESKENKIVSILKINRF